MRIIARNFSTRGLIWLNDGCFASMNSEMLGSDGLISLDCFADDAGPPQVLSLHIPAAGTGIPVDDFDVARAFQRAIVIYALLFS